MMCVVLNSVDEFIGIEGPNLQLFKENVERTKVRKKERLQRR
jgi:hypothetical protein